ncbi:MAG: hypothetical protein FGM37_00710 [Phycisphaerales bacterium]|nr:hypothetical protein [Phycisphaerales bacterium]
MAISTPLSIDDEGVLNLMPDFDALRTWELIRVSKAPVTVDRIVLAFDDGNPRSVARATRSADSVRDEFTRCVAQHADASFHPKEGFRFRLHCMKRCAKEDLAELRRLMLPVVAFLSTPRPVPARGNDESNDVSGVSSRAPREREVALALAARLARYGHRKLGER